MKLLGRIGISIIFKRHFQTYYDYGEYKWSGKRKVPTADVLTFLVMPFVLAVAMIYFDPKLMISFSSLIVTCLSIFIGLLFNLLILALDLAKKEKERLSKRIKEESETKNTENKENADKEQIHLQEASFTLIKELFVNVSYAIGLSIFCVIAIFISKFRPLILIDILKSHEYFVTVRTVTLFIINVVIVFLLIQFILTLLMILRRFFIVFNNQVETLEKE